VLPGVSPDRLGVRGRRTVSRGQAMVEFALALPILLVLLFAIIDWGYYLFVSISVNQANRAGVRKAAMNNLTKAQIRQLVVDNAVGVVMSTSDVTVTTYPAGSSQGFPFNPPVVEVRTSFDHKFFTPSLMGRSSMPVKSSFKTIISTYYGREVVTF